MFTPSIYHFVTAAKDSSEESEKNGSNTLWPGLNGTERDYALVSVSFALFETILFPLPMLMMDSLPFTLLMLLTFSLFTVAGVVYGCATHIWMVFVARGLMGAAALFASSIIYTYTGEIGSIMDMERLKMRKKPMKGTLYLAITFTTHGYHIINPRRACAARVTVVGFVCLSVCLSVCVCVCVSVCYSSSHFSSVRSSHKGYHLVNGQ
ncbi:hypothetical protein GBAR_LOCUS30061 [Geodia barretti]|uniref:Uncharacterized protein n=1 Tax=Geodia barretti TaxID=519541 RepID=A0AA35TXX0_GEOBA|nr:hypothetical protein GBAR_LOCUS30061 [Geodia barretti]